MHRDVALSSATFGPSGVQSPTAGHILVYVLITHEIMDGKCLAEGTYLVTLVKIIVCSRDSAPKF